MFVVDLRNSFPLEDYHWFKFQTISTARQYDCNSILLVSRGADFNGLLSSVVDRTVWRHVECERSLVHVSNEMQWVAVFLTEINDEASDGIGRSSPRNRLADVVLTLFSVVVTDRSSS